MKHAPAKVGVITKLEEERCLQTTDVALRGILKIEIIIGDQPINRSIPVRNVYKEIYSDQNV